MGFILVDSDPWSRITDPLDRNIKNCRQYWILEYSVIDISSLLIRTELRFRNMKSLQHRIAKLYELENKSLWHEVNSFIWINEGSLSSFLAKTSYNDENVLTIVLSHILNYDQIWKLRLYIIIVLTYDSKKSSVIVLIEPCSIYIVRV